MAEFLANPFVVLALGQASTWLSLAALAVMSLLAIGVFAQRRWPGSVDPADLRLLARLLILLGLLAAAIVFALALADFDPKEAARRIAGRLGRAAQNVYPDLPPQAVDLTGRFLAARTWVPAALHTLIALTAVSCGLRTLARSGHPIRWWLEVLGQAAVAGGVLALTYAIAGATLGVLDATLPPVSPSTPMAPPRAPTRPQFDLGKILEEWLRPLL